VAKHQPKPKPAPASLIAAQIDELGALEREIAPWRPKLDRAESLRKIIRAAYNDEDAGQTFEASGERFLVSIGPRATQRVVNIPALIKAIGLKAYAAIASVTLAVVEKNVPPGVADACIASAPTGPRSLKIFERG
jgi:hypothetical protein